MVPAGHEKNSPEPVTMQKFATYILSKWTKSFKYVALYEFTLDVAQLETAITFFVGENITPVSMIWVQIKFRKICWIDNYSWSIEEKNSNFSEKFEINYLRHGPY